MAKNILLDLPLSAKVFGMLNIERLKSLKDFWHKDPPAKPIYYSHDLLHEYF